MDEIRVFFLQEWKNHKGELKRSYTDFQPNALILYGTDEETGQKIPGCIFLVSGFIGKIIKFARL